MMKSGPTAEGTVQLKVCGCRGISVIAWRTASCKSAKNALVRRRPCRHHLHRTMGGGTSDAFIPSKALCLDGAGSVFLGDRVLPSSDRGNSRFERCAQLSR